MSKLSHLDEQGRASMVDVSEKASTERIATAEAIILISQETFDLVTAGEIKKGDVLATARIAGIMAAKKTSELIPLCHPLALTHAGIEFTPLPERHAFRIVASAKTTGQTGVEMEALTAASVAALTAYNQLGDPAPIPGGDTPANTKLAGDLANKVYWNTTLHP